MLDQLVKGSLPTEAEAQALVRKAAEVLAPLPALVQAEVPAGATLHVVGDIHGQLPELRRVLEVCGLPVPRVNLLLFNGDFVDRGPCSVEVMLSLFALVVSCPEAVFLNRGNHETRSMNRVYGFEEEVLQKYSRDTFEVFQQAFAQLPLATLVNESVLVTHGGLPASDGIKVADIASLTKVERPCHGLYHDLLWADPSSFNGRNPSPRGAGIFLFGPDVAERFCEENGLLCLIRSHEVVMNGYAWQPGGRCLTVFSAANYVGRAGNLGAVCHIRPPSGGRVEAQDISFSTFEGASKPLPMQLRSRL